MGLLLLLVGRLRLHAAMGLTIAAMVLGVAAGIPLEKVPLTFTSGAGEMMGHIAIILGMGALLGQLLASSGAGAALGRAMVDRCGTRGMPWALLALGILVGMPVFFEVGLVLLLPIVMDAARRSGRPPILVGLPVLAGLSIMHGLLPPHPAALLAATEYHAPLASVILWGLVAGVPAAMLAGPVSTELVGRCGSGEREVCGRAGTRDDPLRSDRRRRRDPSPQADSTPAGEAGDGNLSQLPAGALLALLVILLPVALILAGGWADAIAPHGKLANQFLHLAGFPDVAMVMAALVALAMLGGRVQEPAYRSSRRFAAADRRFALLPSPARW